MGRNETTTPKQEGGRRNPAPAAAADPPAATSAPAAARVRNRPAQILAGLGLVVALGAGFAVGDGPTLWGLLPIVLYAILCLLGMDIVLATMLSLLAGLLVLQPAPVEIGNLLGESLADMITMIGLIIMLGAGVGEVLTRTGVARTIVVGVMRVVGEKHRIAAIYGVMISCTLLVASLGTLAGALAIAAPILLPIAAQMRFTKSATASMMFIGGCAGLAIAPFAGSNVAIMSAAEVGYLPYLIHGGGPLAVLSLLLGPFIVQWMQRRTARTEDFYDPAELGTDRTETPAGAGRSTAVFAVVLLASVAYAVWSEAGTSFPLLALPVIGLATGLAGRLEVTEILALMYRGAASLINIFILFWLLAALFLMVDMLAPFEVILETYQDGLSSSSPFVFTLLIALLGWVGVPGATAAQVVLLHEVFGPLGAGLGISAASWIVVLLFASKADTYGPFPNGNMAGVMGLARSANLRNMMITGWMLLVPVCLMYGTMLFIQTR